MTPWAWLEITTCLNMDHRVLAATLAAGSRAPQPPRRVVDGSRAAVYQMNQIRPLERGVLCTYQLLRTRCDTHHPLQTPNCDGKFYRFGFGWMVVRFVRVIRVPACARVSRVSRVCPGSPRCLSAGFEVGL